MDTPQPGRRGMTGKMGWTPERRAAQSARIIAMRLGTSSPPAERFWPKVRAASSGCWSWQAQIKPNGYGAFYDGTRKVYAHRFAYELLLGPIPEGLDLDHLCRNRGCVNPSHLEPTSRLLNLARGQHPNMQMFARQQDTGMCPKGHELSPDNTLRRSSSGQPMCKTCNRERCNDSYRRRKEALITSTI